jgi:hypothetical protein
MKKYIYKLPSDACDFLSGADEYFGYKREDIENEKLVCSIVHTENHEQPGGEILQVDTVANLTPTEFALFAIAERLEILIEKIDARCGCGKKGK